MPKFSVEKSIDIQASPEDVFAKVRDFKTWPLWSPWILSEPDCQLAFSDDGRSYSWDGKVVGAGEMEILDETPSTSIDYSLTFLRPWKSTAELQFRFAPNGSGGTRATWTLDSSLPFFMFWMTKMMVGLIGMDYERGLKMLKDLVETGAVPSKLDFPGTETFPGTRLLTIRRGCAVEDMPKGFDDDMAKLVAHLCERDITPCGAPMSAYLQWKPAEQFVEYELGFPVEESVTDAGAGFRFREIPTCQTYVVRHTGPYRHLGNGWAAGMSHAQAKVFPHDKKAVPFERYETPPEQDGEATVTTVFLPTK